MVNSMIPDLFGLLLRMELSPARKFNYIGCYMIFIGALQKHFANWTSTLHRTEFKVHYLRLVGDNLEIRQGSKNGGWPGQDSARSVALV